LTLSEALWAAALAALCTWLYLWAGKALKRVFGPIAFKYSQEELKKVVEKCCAIFYGEILAFNGKTFKRGMRVRVVTSRGKVFEGSVIGVNDDNMICVINSQYVLTHDLKGIVEIEAISAPDSDETLL
jgi:hypothetical protein